MAEAGADGHAAGIHRLVGQGEARLVVGHTRPRNRARRTVAAAAGPAFSAAAGRRGRDRAFARPNSKRRSRGPPMSWNPDARSSSTHVDRSQWWSSRPTNNRRTPGLLGAPDAGGCTGLIRMSMVQKPSGKKSHIPAFGLKLLIDGEASADLLAMNHTIGQGRDFDMFSNSMTNDLTETHARDPQRPQRLMARLFARVSDEPRRLTVNHLVDRRPRWLRRHRPGRARPTDLPTDGRGEEDLQGQGRGRLPAGPRRRRPGYGPLHGRRCVSARAGDQRRFGPVGVLRTTTRFVSSPGGDRLFFRHVQDEAALAPNVG